MIYSQERFKCHLISEIAPYLSVFHKSSSKGSRNKLLKVKSHKFSEVNVGTDINGNF